MVWTFDAERLPVLSPVLWPVNLASSRTPPSGDGAAADLEPFLRLFRRRQPPRDTSARPWLLVGIPLFLLLGVKVLSDVYVDLLWFDALGYRDVYLTVVGTRVGLFAAGAIGFLVIFLGNLFIAPRVLPDAADTAALPGPLGEDRQPVTTIAAGVGAAMALVSGAAAAAQWDTVLRFASQTPFFNSDPIFGNDIAFYVFTMPVARFVQRWALAALAAALLGVLAVYVLRLGGRLPLGAAARQPKAHVTVLLALALLVYAAGNLLDTYDLLLSRHSVLYGVSYADASARIPAYLALAGAGALAALLLVASIFVRGRSLPVAGIGLWAAVLALGTIVYPALVQRLVVQPNEQTKEAPYILHGIEGTRTAFALDRIVEQAFPVRELLTPEDITANPETIKNVRLWDHRPLRDTYNQIQSIRLYYEFGDIDVDRYVVNGEERQVMLGTRELSLDKLPEQARTWVNHHLQYTHGYGVAVSPVNEAGPEGLPSFWLKDVPPTGIIPITRPEVYFGERSSEFIIVKTREAEFDYPKEGQNATTFYQADSGVLLTSLLRRLAFAVAFGDLNIVLTERLTTESRVLFHRSVRDRVARIAPFLTLDHDPYMVIDEGRLVWILDAYTTSNRYPYSEPLAQGSNYVRNSVKVTIDAYDGAVRFYVAEPDDPIVQTYARVFPGLFRPLAELPAGLRGHLRYPEDLFNWQAEMYCLYHMRDAQSFYNREDAYDRPLESNPGRPEPMAAYYVIMRLPDADRAEFLLMLPFTPVNKNNTIAWLAARSDGEHYGKLLAYTLPKDRLIYGPLQIDARMDQDPAISREMTLWNQQGSQVVRGNLLMIPINHSFLYVEPVFLQAQSSQLPELKRVVVATGNRLVMEPTLAQALARLFGEQAVAGQAPAVPGGLPPRPPTGAEATPELAALVKQAREQYAQAREALRKEDWVTYGKALNDLAATLDELARMTER